MRDSTNRANKKGVKADILAQFLVAAGRVPSVGKSHQGCIDKPVQYSDKRLFQT